MVEDLIDVEPFAIDEVLKGARVEKLHHNEELTMVKAKVMNSNDVRMRKICRSARLLTKTLLEGAIIRIIFMQNFDRDRSL